jgi:ribose transport system ATP-binding protein
VPADRLRQGGVRNLSIRDNIVLPDAAHYWRHRERERAVLRAAIDEFDIQPPNPAALFERLSGGNQQKVVLSKWLLVQPSVLVLDDPTSGVDPRSRRLVFDAVRSATAQGITVILLSSEHEQLIAMCSRVYVLRAGSVAAQLAGSELTREALALWSFV